MQYILAIDQGTSSSRGVVYDEDLNPVGIGQRSLPSEFPKDGWVEQDANLIWQTVIDACREAIEDAEIQLHQLAGIGITNQRETSVLWDAYTSDPICKAIVWQDRRTTEACEKLKNEGLEEQIFQRTGLVVDPYFSSTKLAWLMDTQELRKQADENRVRWGTVDSFLLWRLTNGKIHATEATNASRTQLYDINLNEWSEELLDYFRIPASVLPHVRNSTGTFGIADKEWFGKEIPILGIAGDQQAALIGQACFEPGMAKATYGTGCFLIANTGEERRDSSNGLLTTIAYKLDCTTTYGIEGSIFNAGTAIQWLRDRLHCIEDSGSSEESARRTEGNTRGVYVVPAFTGLGAPHWNPDARGLICGLTLDSGIDEIVTATLKSVGYQSADLLQAVLDAGLALSRLRVDGGMARNEWFCQFLADVTGAVVDRPKNVETTSAGAAVLAWLGSGHISSLEQAAQQWQLDASFQPLLGEAARAEEMSQWHAAVSRAM